jgi:hypothetical protein
VLRSVTRLLLGHAFDIRSWHDTRHSRIPRPAFHLLRILKFTKSIIPSKDTHNIMHHEATDTLTTENKEQAPLLCKDVYRQGRPSYLPNRRNHCSNVPGRGTKQRNERSLYRRRTLSLENWAMRDCCTAYSMHTALVGDVPHC